MAAMHHTYRISVIAAIHHTYRISVIAVMQFTFRISAMAAMRRTVRSVLEDYCTFAQYSKAITNS
jgi:hypothetical protein